MTIPSTRAPYSQLSPEDRATFDRLDLAAQAHPIVFDDDGTVRFQADPLIRSIAESGPLIYAVAWKASAEDPAVRPRDVLRFYRNAGCPLDRYAVVLDSNRDYFAGLIMEDA